MRKKLKDVCNFYSGTGFPVKHQGEKAGELPFYKVGDIANNATSGNVYLSTCNNYISYEVAKEIKGTVIPEDVVVFAKIGEALKLNRRAITSKKCLIDNNAMGIGAKKEYLDSHFFYFFMKNLKMESLAESTTVPSVRKSKLEEIEIDIPSFEIQKNISKILRKLENIIKDRQSQILKFDMLVKARFVEMFGNLREGECKGIKLGELCNTVSGGTPSTKFAEYYEGDIPWITTTSLGPNHIDGTTAKAFITKKAIDNSATKLIPAGNILFGTRVGVGKSSLNDVDICTNQDIAAIVGIDENRFNKLFIKYVLDFYQPYYNSIKKGATILGITSDDLKNTIVPDVSLCKQNAFETFVEQIDKSKVAIQKSLAETQLLFDKLMQDYFG